MTKPRQCKDCEPGSIRPTPHPGPRCATHHRLERKRRSEHNHGRQVESKYEITADEYWALYCAQGGRCACCGIATGKTKRLAVDHDHELAKTHDHPVDRGCRRCIRGLCCGRCNRYGVPLNLPAVIRTLNYLSDPPARKVLR